MSPLQGNNHQRRIENMKTDLNKIIFTNEVRATLESPDSSWVINEQDAKTRNRPQEGRGGVKF